jgi:hypothetical protein
MTSQGGLHTPAAQLSQVRDRIRFHQLILTRAQTKINHYAAATPFVVAGQQNQSFASL